MMKYRLQDLIDLDHFQNLQDRLNKIYSFPSSIIDNDGNILTATAWQDVCTQFHRKNKECERECIKSDQYIKDHLHEANPAVSYRCPHGLVDNATPIIIDGIHYGNFFTGQFFLEKPDLEYFRAQARKYGFHEGAYIEAVERVPIWTQEQLGNYLFFIKGLIEVITESGMKRLKEIENRKQIEKSTQRHRSILKTAIDGFIMTDSQGKLIEVNEAYCGLSGYSANELLTMHISNLEAMEAPRQVASHIHKMRFKGADRFESQHRKKDGTLFDVEISVQFRPDEGGVFFSFIRDITNRKKAERDQKKLEMQLASAMEIAHLGHWEYDVENDQFTFNDQFYKIFHTSVEQVGDYLMSSGEYTDRFVHPEDKEMIGEEIRKCIETSDPNFNRQLEHRILYADGKIGYISVRIFIVKDDQGKTIKTYGVNQDVTGRKQAFEEIKKANEKMQLAADAAHFGIWNFDIKENRLEWDDWMFRLYGISQENFGGAYEAWQAGVHPDDLGRSMKAVEQALKGEKKFDTEFRIVRPDGSVRYIKAHATTLRDSNGTPTQMIGVNYDVTEQKTAEFALKESEERFRLSFMTSPDAINLNRLEDGLYIDINEGYTQIMGYTRDEIIGRSSLSMNIWKNPEDRETLVEGLKADGYVNNLEAEFIGKDGNVRYGLMSARIIVLNHETVILSITRDITERKISEKALYDSEKYMRSIFRAAPTGIGVVRNRIFSQVNEKFCEMLGYTQDELIGQNARMIYPNDEAYERVGKEKYEEIERLGTGTIETEFKRKDGAKIHVLLSSTPIDVNDQSAGVTFTALDISSIKETQIALERSEAKYRQIIEAIRDPVYISSQDYKIQYSNTAMLNMLGYDATGEYCYSALHGFDEKCPWCQHKKILEKGFIEKNITSPKYNRSYNVSSTVIINKDGSKSTLSVLRDTTDFLALQNRLQQAQKMESIGNLAGGIAHDFNNILFPIMGLSEMLMEDFPPGSPERENAEEIFKAGKRGGELVKQILAFSRQTEHKMVPTRLQYILKEVLKLTRSSIPSYIEIKQNIQPDCGLILADPIQLHQIAMNIITNAFHAVGTDSGRISIQLNEMLLNSKILPPGVSEPGRYAVLSISDTGHGISPDIMDKIFEPYFTTKEQGKGTGLGLAVVYGIIKEHKGAIEVNSTVGKGTTFTIYLPLMDKTAEVYSQPETEKLLKGNERILIVDDEEAVAKLEKQMLERLGYNVTCRFHSLEALEVFKVKPFSFDLIISDMTMPSLTGAQLVERVLAERSDIPIIICTGFSEKIDAEKAKTSGISGFLMKPIVHTELAKMVRKVLDEAKNSTNN